jgi:sialate O-acetylesterase
MHVTCPLRFAVFALACQLGIAAHAALVLAPPFTDHAVLQRDIAVPIWGWDGPPGTLVTVAYGGQIKSTVVGQTGLWRVDLDPLAGSASGSDLIVTGSTVVTLHDVVVGEVWIASGQSNMEWPLEKSAGFSLEQARPPDPLIRQLHLEPAPADLPVATVRTDGWRIAAPDTVGGFTGVGYFFARQIAENLRLPVGILHCAWGGSPIESWLPEPILRSSSAWPRFSVEWQEVRRMYAREYARQSTQVAAWEKSLLKAQVSSEPTATAKTRPAPKSGPPFGPGSLFNGMLTPLVPYAIRGALWYQGESNVGREREYAELLPALVRAWRTAWPQGDFPFLLVQLPGYTDSNHPATGRAWAQLREVQASLRLPATGMAVIIDSDEPTNLHPTDKRTVGERLALIALRQVHGVERHEASGPLFLSMERTEAGLRLRFAHANGLRSMTTAVTGFEIAGTDRIFHPATAQIDQETVVVGSPAVSAPVAVRYAYTNAPTVSLVNAAGLPAAPFRTDDW